MRLSHVCREAKCPYSLLCADCLATNTPHVQLHKAWLEPLHWVEARFSAIKGSQVHGSLSQLVDLVARLAQDVPNRIDSHKNSVLKTFEDCKARFAEECDRCSHSLTGQLSRLAEESTARLEQLAVESRRLLEEVAVNKSEKSKEYEAALRQQGSQFLVLKQVFRRMSTADDSNQLLLKTYNSLLASFRKQQKALLSGYSLDLRKAEELCFELNEDMFFSPAAREKTLFSEIPIVREMPLIDIQSLAQDRPLSVLKYFSFPHKLRGLYLGPGLEFLVQYRNGYQAYCLTQVLNHFRKEGPSALGQQLLQLELKLNLQGKIYAYRDGLLAVGTKEGQVLVSHISLPQPNFAIKVSSNRVTAISFGAGCQDMLVGTEGGSVSRWTLGQHGSKLDCAAQASVSRVTGLATVGPTVLCLCGSELLVLDYSLKNQLTLNTELRSSSKSMPTCGAAVGLQLGRGWGLALLAANDDKRVCCVCVRVPGPKPL